METPGLNAQTLITRFEESPAYREGQALLQQMLARSATDMTFREQLLTDPKAAIAEFRGDALPPEFDALHIEFVENQADVTIVLPELVRPESELSDDDLEHVAGGNPAAGAVISISLGGPAGALVGALVGAGIVVGAYLAAEK